MKTILMMLFATLTASASTIDNKQLVRAVVDDIEGLVGETVNEGSQTADVVYKDGEPVASCKLSNNKQNPNAKWAFCKVEFDVKMEELNEETVRECQLLYSVEIKNGKIELTRDEDKISSCLEDLSESI